MTLPAYTRSLNQTAIYWSPGIGDGFGSVVYGPAVEIICRWQDVAVLFRSSDGEEKTSSAVVYVDRVLQIKGMIVLGSLTDELAYSDPIAAEAREIRQVGVSPSLRADKQLNKVYL